jgi:hypothetical protein
MIASAGIVDSMWTRIWSGTGGQKYNAAARVMYDSARQRIYVCGRGETSVDPYQVDMMMLCYDLFGNLMWSHSVGWGLDADNGFAMAVDAAGFVYLAGLTMYYRPDTMNIVVVKYDSLGNGRVLYNSQWDYNEIVYDMIAPPNGKLYLCGATQDTVISAQSAYFVVCLDTMVSQFPVWQQSYILSPAPAGRVPPSRRPKQSTDVYPEFVEWDYGDWDNCATSIALAPDGDIVTAGFGWYSAGQRDDYDWWIMKFNPANGTRRWARQFSYPNTTVHDDDFAFDVVVGRDSAIYVAGMAYRESANAYSNEFAVARFRGSDGVRQAYTRVDQQGGDDVAFGVCVDDSSLYGYHVYATGYIETPGQAMEDIATVKLTSSTLAREWLNTYDGEEGDDHGYEVYYKSGRVYVTGVRGGGGGGQDKIVALGFTASTPSGGNKDTLWSYVYHHPGTLSNMGASIVVADTNKVFVAGQAERSGLPLWSSLYLSRLAVARPDVAVKRIVAPQDTVALGAVIDTPRVWVKNQGNLLPTFKTYLRIGSSYTDSATVATLKPGDSALVKFKSWTASPMGMVVVRCSAASAPDTNMANNVLVDTVYVAKLDAACLRISAPTGSVDSGVAIVPQAWLRNFGNLRQTFRVRFTIGSAYADTQQATINAGESLLQGFRSWTPVLRGSFATLCSTMLTGDQTDTNNRKTGTVTVRVRDLAAIALLAPADSADSGTTVTPKLRVANLGSEQQTFWTFFKMEYGTDTVGYLDSLSTTLAPAGESLLTFKVSGPLNRLGNWRCAGYTGLPDQHPENDTLRKNLYVKPPFGNWPAGWVEVANVPPGPSGRAVKGGGAVTAIQDTRGLVYVAKGYKTAEFFAYNIFSDAWADRKPIPPGTEAKLPYNGCDLANDGNRTIYMTKGNNTLGFWKYTTDDSTWTQLTNVPLGVNGNKVKAGAGLAWYQKGDSGFVYLLKGYKNEFFRYNVATGNWETKASAPIGINIKYDKGSFLVYDGGAYMYAHKAKYNELYRYDIARDSWRALTGMPFFGRLGQKKKSKDGGSGTWNDGRIYALKGGNTQEFWRYTAAADSWFELDTMPAFGTTSRRKKVKDGGDICFYARACWALKGNKTREFWRYGFPIALGSEPRSEREGVASAQLALGDWRLAITPNPLSGTRSLRLSTGVSGPATVRLYDALGRCVKTWNTLLSGGSAWLDLKGVPSAAYVLRVDTGQGRPAQSMKLVVQ